MSRLYIILLFLTLAVQSTAQNSMWSPEEDNLRGLVACIEMHDSASEGFIPEETMIVCGAMGPLVDSSYSEHVLDDRGNQLSYTYYNQAREFERRVTCEYDERNNRIRSVIWRGKDRPTWIIEFKYDAKGIPIERTIIDDSGNVREHLKLQMKYHTAILKDCNTRMDSLDSILYNNYILESRAEDIKADISDTTTSFDSLGRKKLKVVMKKDETVHTYLYDHSGRELEKVEYNKYGEKEHTLQYEYNNAGNMEAYIEMWERDYSIEGLKREFIYDITGNKTGSKHYEIECGYFDTGENAKWEARFILYCDTLYDKAGRILEITENSQGGALASRKVYSYDAYGNLINQKEYDKNNSLRLEIFCRYEDFDKQGNWRKKTKWIWGTDEPNINLPKVTRRTITYHQ